MIEYVDDDDDNGINSLYHDRDSFALKMGKYKLYLQEVPVRPVVMCSIRYHKMNAMLNEFNCQPVSIHGTLNST